MILEYKFEYLSNNDTLINFLIDIADQEDIKFEITRHNDEINLYIDANEDEMLSFSDKISFNLPVSMFFKNASIEVVDQMPKSNYKTNIIKKDNLSFCPKCLQEVENEKSPNYYNPFTTCTMCANTNNIKEFIITQKNRKEKIKEYKKVFENLANNINNGLKIKIKTLSGTFVFEKIDNLKDQDEQKNINLLCTNLMNISNVVVAKKAEVVALASIEKPQINLKINEVYKYKNIVKTNNVNVRYANDLILYLLSKELITHGIDFLSYKQEGDHDISLDFENFSQDETIEIPKIKILDNDRLVILKSNNYDEKLTQIYNKFDEPSKSQAIVLISENNLFSKKILNFYNSTKQDDNIVLYADEIGGFLDVLKYKLPKSMQELFDEISQDETGGKLLNNYKKLFPQNYENALNFDISTLDKNSIFSFWKIVEIVLDFKDSILNLAAASLLEKGPRIDYKLTEQEKIYNKTFNIVKFIKSGISFKLAGVDDTTISLGYIESYTHFISNIIDEVNNEIELDGVSLSGDIFTYDIVSQLVHKSITKNFKIYYNRDFPIQI